MWARSLCAALAACAVLLDGASAREHGRLGKIARRGPERAAKLAQAQQSERMRPRDTDPRFSTEAAESQYSCHGITVVPANFYGINQNIASSPCLTFRSILARCTRAWCQLT